MAAFHESLRITLEQTVAKRAKEYSRHEAVLREAVQAMGCHVTSNMTSLIVLNLPKDLAGREMEMVQNCRSVGFWYLADIIYTSSSSDRDFKFTDPSCNKRYHQSFRSSNSRHGVVKLTREISTQFLDRHYSIAVAAE